MKIDLEEFEYSVGMHFKVTADDDTERALLLTCQNEWFLDDSDNEDYTFKLTLPVSNGD